MYALQVLKWTLNSEYYYTLLRGVEPVHVGQEQHSTDQKDDHHDQAIQNVAEGAFLSQIGHNCSSWDEWRGSLH